MAKKKNMNALARAQKGHRQRKKNLQKLGLPAKPQRKILNRYSLTTLDSFLTQAEKPLQNHLIQLPPDIPRVVFFSFTNGATRSEVVHFTGDSFEDIWQQCLSWVKKKRNFYLKLRWLRIDWVVTYLTLSWEELQKRIEKSKRNYFRYGIALDTDFCHAFLEQELNANAMLYSGNQIPNAQYNPKNFQRYAKQRFGSAVPGQSSCLFTTEGLFFQSGKKPVPLNGYSGGKEGRNTGRRSIDRLTDRLVFNIINDASQFLTDQVQANGRFIYGIHPCFDREINTYNALRHVSTTYSMLEAWEVTRSHTLMKAAIRAIHYMENTLVRNFFPGSDHPHLMEPLSFVVDEGDEIKLGASGVALLALVKYTELTGDKKYLSLMRNLAQGIKWLQDPETGQFVHVLHARDLSVKDSFRIVYYDGEAVFGLVRYYSLIRDESWLEVVVKAFDYFIKANHWKHHDHWLSYSVNEITLYRPEERYYLFGLQNVGDYLDFVIERITTFPTLLELMMAAHKMITRLEQSREHGHLLAQLDTDKFYLALETRAHYLLNGFFWPEIAMYYQNPQRILGSFFIRHHGFRVRIDDVEHYISGFVAYLQHYLKRQ